MLDNNMELTGPIFINEDVSDERLEILNDLLLKVGDDQKEIIEREIKLIEIGAMGEANVMYELRHTREKILVLHDITIKDSLNNSQIDFLIITRCGIIVLETKRLVGDIEINSDGDFIRHYKNAEGKVFKKEGIYSPITQNKYHIDAVIDLLKENNIVNDIPCYSLVVIANPKTIIDKTYAKDDVKQKIIKYDQLNENINALIKAHGGEYNISDRKMIEIAQFISKSNEPREYDYIERLGLNLIENEIEDVAIIDGMSNKNPKDDKLYEALRKYRFNKAKELNYKLFRIFSNKQLEELVLKRPTNKEEFLKLYGFGENKYLLFGEDIIKLIIKDNNKNNDLNPFDDEIDNKLFKSLRRLRFNLSKKEEIEPYMIYTNSQMEEIIRRKPKSLEELLSVEGIGRARCEKYGKEIIAVINYKSKKNI